MASPTTWGGYEVSRHNLFQVSPLALKVDADLNISRGGEPVTLDDDLIKLADNILAYGQFSPVVVKNVGKGEYVVVMGSRRLEAARHLVTSGKDPNFLLKCVPSDGDDETLMFRNLSENLHRLEPKPIHTAKALQLLLTKFGSDRQTVGERLGRSGGWVDYHLGLLTTAPSVQTAVEMGELPVTAATELAKIDDAEGQEKALEKMREQGAMSAEGARSQRRQTGAKVKRGVKAVKDFLKQKSQEGEVANNMAKILLDYWEGTLDDDQASTQWDRNGMLLTNFDMDTIKTDGEKEAA